jgi:hypothetical protein
MRMFEAIRRFLAALFGTKKKKDDDHEDNIYPLW